MPKKKAAAKNAQRRTGAFRTCRKTNRPFMPNDSSPVETPFPFKRLPPEIRLIIYPLNDGLKLCYNKQAPALLLALAADKDLYEEYKDLYLKINFCVNNANRKALKKLHISELLKFRHLKIAWDSRETCYDEPKSNSLCGQKITLINNLETVTIDLAEYHHTDDTKHELLQNMKMVIKASKNPKKLFIKFGPNMPVTSKVIADRTSGRETDKHAAIKWINDGLGDGGKLERVSTAECDELWFWARADGGNLEHRAWYKQMLASRRRVE